MRFLTAIAASAAFTSVASALPQEKDFVNPYSAETIANFGCGTHVDTHASQNFTNAIHELQQVEHERRSLLQRGGTLAARGILPRQTTSQPIVVPTYFHVIQTGANAGLITQPMADAQLAALNTAYNPYGISFNLLGTDFTTNDLWAVAAGADMAAAKTTLRKGTYNTLNIYFHTDFAGGDLGTCSLPSAVPPGADPALYVSDGCNVNANTMPGGTMMGYNKGGTAIHETGHWLGLLHTFEGYNCDGPGDYIDDTPAQSVATNGCPAKPPKDSCPTMTGVDPIHNYMDYSIDDCYEGFTPLQVQRVESMWGLYRAGQ